MFTWDIKLLPQSKHDIMYVAIMSVLSLLLQDSQFKMTLLEALKSQLINGAEFSEIS